MSVLADGGATDRLSQTTTYDYDYANELTTITRPDTTTLQDDYWDDGSLKSQTDGNGKITGYTYDPLARLTSVTDPDSRTTSYTYDGAGNLATVVDPASRTTTNTYDDADRLTGVSYSDGVTPNVSYTYDADGQRLTMTDGTGDSSWTWDSLHRLVSQTNGAGQTTGYGYDLANDLTSIVYPGSHTVTRGFDDAGRLHTVQDWLSHTTTFDYDHDDNLTAETYPNGTVATFTPDAADRLMDVADTNGATTFASFDYGRNDNDLVTAVTNGGTPGVGQPNQSYGYSTLNQLNSENSSSYTFDSADNLTGTPAGLHLAYDDANQLCWTSTSTGTCGSPPGTKTSYDYDSLGERTSMTPPAGNPTVNYGYDQAQRLTELRGAEYRTSVLASSPTGYWRLGDPAASTSAVDSSGYAHTGTATSVTFGAGSALGTDNNTAASFNGTTSWVNTGPLAVGSLTAFTDEAWIKTGTTQTSAPYFFSEGNSSGGTPNNQGIGLDSTGTKARFIIHDTTGASFAVAGTTTITNNAWHHVVGVRNGGTVSLYVDGKLDGQLTGQSIGTVSLDTSAIGALRRNTTGQYFNGSLDDVAAYPRALSQVEVNSHYRSGQSNYAGTSTGDGPAGDWRVDETSGANAADASGNGQTGAYSNVTYNATGALSGDSDKAITFKGVNTSHLLAPASSAFDFASSKKFTLEAWVKASSTQTDGAGIINRGYGGGGEQYTIDVHSGNYRFYVRDSGGTVTQLNAATGPTGTTWQHVVAVFDQAAGRMELWIDGTLAASTTPPSSLKAASGNLTIGGRKSSSSDANYSLAVNGTIDEPAIYPTALDPTTIARHSYNGTHNTPAVADYTYNGDGLRTAKEVAGHTTPFTWDTAEGLPLMSGDGTNQYIYGPNGSPLEQVSGSTVIYYHQDQQGSTRALTDSSGNVAATFSTDAYGNPTSSSGTTQTSLRYDGEYRDNETGFQYLRERYYDPSAASFVSRDPAGAVTRSVYGYADSNPLNRADSSGLCGEPAGLVGPTLPCAGGTDYVGPPTTAPECLDQAGASSHSVSGLSWAGVGADFATGWATGLGRGASELSDALRGGSSYAGSTLRSAGETAQMWEPLADAAPVAGAGIVFVADIANGKGLGHSAAEAAGSYVGGLAGAAAGGAACGALAAVTDGAGALTCGVLTGAGAVIGGLAGGWAGNQAASLISDAVSLF